MAKGTAHVWVHRPHLPTPYPGLVLAWRKTDLGEWEALVTYLERRIVDRQQAITEWIPADQLTPVPWHPGLGTAYW